MGESALSLDLMGLGAWRSRVGLWSGALFIGGTWGGVGGPNGSSVGPHGCPSSGATSPCRVQPGLSLCVPPCYHPSVVFHVDSKRHRSLRVFSFFPVLLTATTNTNLFECCCRCVACTGSHLQIYCLTRHHCVWHYLISPAAGPASTFSELTIGTLPTSSHQQLVSYM